MRYKFGGHVEQPSGDRGRSADTTVEPRQARPATAEPAPPCAARDLRRRRAISPSGCCCPRSTTCAAAKLLTEQLRRSSASRASPMSDDEFRAQLTDAICKQLRDKRRGPTTSDIAAWLLEPRRTIVAGDVRRPGDLRATGRAARGARRTRRPAATSSSISRPPPQLFGHRRRATRPTPGSLAGPDGTGGGSIVEKPFGHDLASARDAQPASSSRCCAETQIYRIDHYLGKETVQNIMVLRFGNGIFEPLWNRDYIDHVQITVAETVGVETAAATTTQTGALRDMVPNHLFQLLTLTAMEPPTSSTPTPCATEKAKVLRRDPAASRPRTCARKVGARPVRRRHRRRQGSRRPTADGAEGPPRLDDRDLRRPASC